MAKIFDADLKTPILQWMGRYAVSGDLTISGKDFKMGSSASSRIALGISDTTRATYLAFTGSDDLVFQSMDVSSVIFARNIQERDWLVLVFDDASNGNSKKPVPMRIWLPANAGAFDGWGGSKDQDIHLIHCPDENIDMGIMPDADATPFTSVPLKLQGDWTGVEIIEDVAPSEDDLLPEVVDIDRAPIAMPVAEDEENVFDEINRMREASTSDESEFDGLDIDALLRG